MEKISILSEIIYFLTKYDRNYMLKNCYKLSHFKIFLFGVVLINTMLIMFTYFILSENDRIPILFMTLLTNIFYALVNIVSFFNTNSKIELYFLENINYTDENKKVILNCLEESKLLYFVDKSILNKDKTISSGTLMQLFKKNYHPSFIPYFEYLDKKEYSELTDGEKVFYFICSFNVPFCNYQKEIMDYFLDFENSKVVGTALYITLKYAMSGNKVISYLQTIDKVLLK